MFLYSLYSYEAYFIQQLIKYKHITEAKAFNLTFRYSNDVLSINNPNIANLMSLINQKHIQIKETKETTSSASFLDIYLILDTNCKTF